MMMIQCMLWLILNLFICHLAVSKVSLLFVEAEISQKCDADILDKCLDDGIIIFDQSKFRVRLYNNSAALILQ